MLSIGGVDGVRHPICGGINDGHDKGGSRRHGVHEGESLGALEVGGKRLGFLNSAARRVCVGERGGKRDR